MGKCPQSISSILTHQEHKSFLPASLNLSKNSSYTVGEEGWGKRTEGWLFQGKERGREQHTRLWGAGQQRPRHPHFSPGSFLSKPNLLGDHDKDTIRTIKRLPFYIFLPTPLPLILPTHKQDNHRRGSLQRGGEKPAGINFNLANADKRLGVVCLGFRFPDCSLYLRKWSSGPVMHFELGDFEGPWPTWTKLLL